MAGSPPLKRILEILIIAFLIIFPHYAGLPFATYVIICFALIFFYLKTQNKTLRDIGLKGGGLSGHVFLIGAISAILWMVFVKFIYLPIVNRFLKNYLTTNTDYDFVKHNLKGLLMVVILAWIVGAFYEEIAFRGFIHNAIQKWFIKYKNSFWVAALCTSILFGLYHVQQGISGIIGGIMGGLYWSYLVKRYNGNLWYSIISHGVYDTIALTMIYFDVLNSR
jgi:membrane protease YdiL (CAAX protease family)